jgi:hypothetical protein
VEKGREEGRVVGFGEGGGGGGAGGGGVTFFAFVHTVSMQFYPSRVKGGILILSVVRVCCEVLFCIMLHCALYR